MAGGLLGILAMLVGLGSFICFIIVLIKQFQNAGAIHGIIGIITCGIWTLIWGWMNAGKLGIKNIMMIWTVLIIIYCILAAMGGVAFSYSLGTPTP
jgi:Na+/H+ antiporter NhaC